MKKITLLVATVLLVGNVVNATEVNRISADERTRYSFDEPISFVERGIEFFVFPNGDFDFNTRPQDSEGDYFYKTAGKRGAKATAARGAVNYGTRIEHDSFGRVRRVGNTFINYDNRDRVSRIGTVYMRYNRYALTQIGGMQIVYNRRGDIVDMIGSIKGYRNQGYVYHNNYDYDNNYATNNPRNDDDYYYYKQDGTKAKIEDKKRD
jgi:hypothetical protein